VRQRHPGRVRRPPAILNQDGWVGPDGYAHIAGRAKDMVLVGGFNVYPAEVEQVLAEHPDVAEAAAVGVPDTRLGEVVAVFVVPAPGARPDEAALIAWCRERLANFKVPRHVLMVEALPRAAVGKVGKAELAARARAVLEGS
jgi:HIP---CoA ligase